jgi:hypothetical protein
MECIKQEHNETSQAAAMDKHGPILSQSITEPLNFKIVPGNKESSFSVCTSVTSKQYHSITVQYLPYSSIN